ncbi:MAG: BatD family protein [Verrucomicrobiota bacterium]|nr:BatD family protein [Verrucomicrobiota bacterium]
MKLSCPLSTFRVAGKLIFLLLALLIAFLTQLPLNAAAGVSATLDRHNITLGEKATLSLRYDNLQPQSAPAFPPQPGLKVEYMGAGRQMSVVNGVQSQAVILSYSVTPGRTGVFNIPALKIPVDGKLYDTPSLKLSVLPEDELANQYAFLRLIVGKTNAFVGEVIPLEIQMYYINAQDLQRPQIKGDGFTLGSLVEGARARTEVQGQIYNVITFKSWATAAKAGALNLSSEAAAVVRVSQARKSTGDPFDLFGPQFQLRPLQLHSLNIPVQVQPLPQQQVPSSFTGAVGNFSMTVNPSVTNTAVGDPITLSIEIKGSGALHAIQLPELRWPGFQLYPSTSTIQPEDDLGISGSKTFEQIIIPEDSTIVSIPSLEFSYFNPETRQYRTLKSQPIPLQLRPSQNVVTTNPRSALPAANLLPEDDINHIQPTLGTLQSFNQGLSGYQFVLLNSVPLALFLTVLAYQKRRESRAADLHERERALQKSRISTELKKLSSLRGEAFYDSVFRILQEKISLLTRVPAAGITEQIVTDRLQVEDSLKSRIIELFHLCHSARYGGGDPADPAIVENQLHEILTELKE